MGNVPFFRCSKILGEAGKQEIYNKDSENSRSQIVFRTDIFQKLTLGAANLCFRWDGEKDFYIITIRFSAGDGDLDRLLLALMGTRLWLRVSGFSLNFCLILEEFPGIIFTYMQFILLPLFVSNLAWPLTKRRALIKSWWQMTLVNWVSWPH